MAGNNQAPAANIPPGQAQAAGNAFGDIQGLNNPYAALQPFEMQNLQAMMSNPNLAAYLNSAGMAGQASTGAGNMLLNQAGQLYNTAYDPQNALYNKLSQQQQDQSNVTNSMYGLQSSPYGAGVANQNQQNFDINWQNQQLQRQLAANSAIGQDLGAGVSALEQGGAMPYGAYNSAVGNINDALNQYMTQAGAGNSFNQNAIGDWLQYMGLGQSGVGLNQNAYAQNQQTAANYGAGLYPAAAAGFGALFGGGGSTPGNPANQYGNTALGAGNDPFSTQFGAGSDFGSNLTVPP